MQKENRLKYGVIVFIFICAGVLYFLSILDAEKNNPDVYLVDETMESIIVPQDTELSVESEEVIEITTIINKNYIHVCGEVARPGLYELEEGSRILDAINVAGGFTDYAACDYINLAQLVADGEKIVVPSINEVSGLPESETARGEGSGVNSGGLVNINTASLEELMTLSGIGKSKAESIVSYRESNGPFTKIEDIMQISGIKEAAFKKIKNNIEVR